MSEVREATLTQRRGTYDLKRKGLMEFIEAREEEGEKKYGKGKRNAGYRRDNLMDVIEEVTDAIKIFTYFFERIGKKADATCIYDVRKINEAALVYNTLLDVTVKVDEIREWVDDCFPQLLREDVKRLVALEPQPNDRED